MKGNIMANKVRASYRIDRDTAAMIIDMAAKYSIEKTMVIEIAIRQLYSNQTPLAAAFPVDRPITPKEAPHGQAEMS